MWQHLRNRQLGGFKFRRQYPIDNFILDFYCLEKKIAIELDGSQHITNKASDDERNKVLQKHGIIVLRFWDNEVMPDINVVLETILRHLEEY
jgi:very-short-patch-repair endonuclease